MAMTHLQERLQYKLFLGHVKVLIFNQEVAKNGINKYFNYFRNSAQFNRRSYLLISRNKAVEVLKSVPGNATIPAMYLFNVVDRSLTQGKMPEVPIIDFIIKLEKKGIDPKAIMIDSTEKDLRYIGTAVFRGDRLVGHLNLNESWDLIRLTEGKVGGEIDVQDVEDELGKIALEIINIKKNKMWVEIAEDGNYILKINMRIEGRIVSQEIKNDYSKMELFRQLENRAAKEIARDMVEMIYKTQKKYQADIFGFGKEVQAFLPQEWKRIHNWRNKFINSTIDLNVKFCLRRTGMSYFRGH